MTICKAINLILNSLPIFFSRDEYSFRLNTYSYMPVTMPLFLIVLYISPFFLSESVHACGTYQTCNAVFIQDVRTEPGTEIITGSESVKYTPEIETVNFEVDIMELANWYYTAPSMMQPAVLIVEIADRSLVGNIASYSTTGPFLYGSYLSWWYVQTDNWTFNFEWNGKDRNDQYIDTPHLAKITVYAGAKQLYTTRVMLPKANRKKVLGQICGENSVANPCDASSGNKFQTEVDYQSDNFSFIRYYNSLFYTESALGKQWTHDYLASLTINNTINVRRSDGKVLAFHEEAGSWVSDADITETLTPAGSNWEYKTSNDTVETYNNIGQLLTVTTRDNKITTYSYNANNLLSLVTDPYGKSLNLDYDASGRLITLTTPENTQIYYTYDDSTNNLISVTYQDNTPGDLTDNPVKTYHYENTSFPHHLTGITNENNIRYATWVYDDKGLVILSEHANTAEKTELVYNSNATTMVTDALGQIKTYTFEEHYGLRKPVSIEYTYNDGNQSVTKNKTYTYYPENGQVKEVTDYKNNITYYEYNNRGLVTLETQAKGLLEEYTITTTWHPTYRLPATRTYPDRVVTYSYNSSGQLTNTQTTSIQ